MAILALGPQSAEQQLLLVHLGSKQSDRRIRAFTIYHAYTHKTAHTTVLGSRPRLKAVIYNSNTKHLHQRHSKLHLNISEYAYVYKYTPRAFSCKTYLSQFRCVNIPFSRPAVCTKSLLFLADRRLASHALWRTYEAQGQAYTRRRTAQRWLPRVSAHRAALCNVSLL